MIKVQDNWEKNGSLSNSGITYLKKYFPRFGVRPNNVLTSEQARTLHNNGKYYALLFGNPENPEYYIEIFKGSANEYRRIDVVFLNQNETDHSYHCYTSVQGVYDGLLIGQYRSNERDAEGRVAQFFIADVFVDGDLPTFHFDRQVWHAVSVPWQDFLVGPFPAFDALIDGSFVASLPTITIPPDALLVEHIPQRDRTPHTQKREPIGRFPW